MDLNRANRGLFARQKVSNRDRQMYVLRCFDNYPCQDRMILIGPRPLTVSKLGKSMAGHMHTIPSTN